MAKVSVSDVFPSRWLSAADVENGKLIATIADPALSYEKLKSMNGDGTEEKAVLHFRCPRGTKPLKPMVLNKVNLTTLIVLFGDDDEDYPGKQIEIGVDMVPVGKEIKPGLRIRAWQPQQAAAANSAQRVQRRAQPQPPPDPEGWNEYPPEDYQDDYRN